MVLTLLMRFYEESKIKELLLPCLDCGLGIMVGETLFLLLIRDEERTLTSLDSLTTPLIPFWNSFNI